MAVSDSTVDRWEGLPGVKVQSQGNTTPPALVSGDLKPHDATGVLFHENKF